MGASAVGGMEIALGMQAQLANGLTQNYSNTALNPGEGLANLDAAGTAIQLQGVAVNAANNLSGVNTYA